MNVYIFILLYLILLYFILYIGYRDRYMKDLVGYRNTFSVIKEMCCLLFGTF